MNKNPLKRWLYENDMTMSDISEITNIPYNQIVDLIKTKSLNPKLIEKLKEIEISIQGLGYEILNNIREKIIVKIESINLEPEDFKKKRQTSLNKYRIIKKIGMEELAFLTGIKKNRLRKIERTEVIPTEREFIILFQKNENLPIGIIREFFQKNIKLSKGMTNE